MLVISAYLWHSDQWTARNHNLMAAVFHVVKSLDCPWILAGDFNMSPQCMETSMWPELLQGAVHATNDVLGTCRTTGGPRNYDFFIVDKRISSAVERLWVDREADTWARRPVHMVSPLFGKLKDTDL